MGIGPRYIGDGRCEFTVWAPLLDDVALRLLSQRGRVLSLEKDDMGYWRTVADVPPETRYLYMVGNKKERPDPASNFQPEGVHGPSQIIDHGSFQWEDKGWSGIPLPEMIIYELHIGTFTAEGTFDAVIPRVSELLDIGINTLEIMPVSQFPGERNWGYDGAYPFAVQNSYGGPDGLKRLVNECHKRGIAVILDVVYNHFGPEGSYFRDFGPYFTDRYKTPWGDAVNFDGAYSDGVRDFFIENALFWPKNYHIDALRLDAVHGIMDMSALPFLKELKEKVDEFSSATGGTAPCEKRLPATGRPFYLIAESDLNDPKVVRPGGLGGYGFDAQWCDDFHHSLHTLLTGEKEGYYSDFGKIAHLEKSIREGFVYTGEYSDFRRRRHGASSVDVPAEKFIVFSQNHDQVGNRMLGSRLSSLVSFEALKLAAGAVLLSPYIPLIFMGEEYGEDAPFLYFVSHSDAGLAEAVRDGRKSEFAAFRWKGEIADPQSVETFLRSKLKWDKRKDGSPGAPGHGVLLDYYKELIRLRKETPVAGSPWPGARCREPRDPFIAGVRDPFVEVEGSNDDKMLLLRRGKKESRIFCIFNFNDGDKKRRFAVADGKWRKAIDSADKRWKGPGSLLPEILGGGAELTLRGKSLAAFVKEA